jgi:colanic acid/amylovoran biosynthesis glycosyltransferase
MKVAYVVDRFPVLSQTFVVNEIADHLRNGLDVEVLSMGAAETADFPADHLPPIFAGRVSYLDIDFSRNRNAALIAKAVARSPGISAAVASACLDTLRTGYYPQFRLAALVARLASLQGRYAVIHSHFGHVAAIVGRAATIAGLGARTVGTIHAFEVARKSGLVARRPELLIGSTDLLLPVNTVWRDDLIAAGADPRRVIVHHMGVDTRSLAPPVRSPGEPDRLSLAVTGRLVEKKGHVVALAALAALRDRRPTLRATLAMVGDGPLAAELRDRIRALGLGDRVTMLGARSHAETLNIVREADAFVLPSVTASDGDMEGIPVALMEAMAMKVPVLSTRHSGIPELVEDEVSGLLCAEHDAEALSHAIARLADAPELRARLGAGGRAKVCAAFEAETLGRELRNHYHRLVGARRQTA